MNESSKGFGFGGTIDAERHREIASMGGKAVPSEKRMFSQDRSLAAAAGRKGGRRKRVPEHLEKAFQALLDKQES